MDAACDVAVVGAGAAGLFAALAAAGALEASAPPRRVLLLDGESKPGKKILISGGGRCNVTNADVRVGDFDSRRPHTVRAILAEFPVPAVRAFFDRLGVRLAEEPLGKLFPQSGRARGVLEALLGAVRDAGVGTAFGRRVERVERVGKQWIVDGVTAGRVVIATGGRSVPKTGSTGFGLGLAERLGHDVVPTVPALAPLVGAATEPLAGVTVPAILSVLDADRRDAGRDAGRPLGRAAGSLLFTHRGVSGPAALDVSVHVERRLAERLPVRVVADFWTLADPRGPLAGHAKPPGACLRDPPPRGDVERHLRDAAREDGRRTLGTVLAARLPRRLVRALVADADVRMAELTREARRRAAEAVLACDLGITGTEGYAKAEVTAGGVDLAALDRRTLESRVAPGLHFCGEVLDATGRLGGFNFQWAWSSGFVAGRGAAAATA